MKTISTTAIMALTTAAIGLATLAPAMAQPAPQNPQFRHHQQIDRPGQMGGHFRFQQRREGGMGDLIDFGRTAERIEMQLVRLAYRLDLTEPQKGLLESLRTALLDANGAFTTATEPATADSTTPPTAGQRLDLRIAAEEAHLAALKSVQPAFTAFFDSLTDEQKAELAPRQGARGGEHGHRRMPPDASPNDAKTIDVVPAPASPING